MAQHKESGPLWGTMVERAYALDSSCCEQMTDHFYDHNDNGRWDSYPNTGAEGGGNSSGWRLIC